MLQGVEPLKIFISSVMRRDKEDLSAEREAACTAIERLQPIASPWAFENEAASTKRLRDSYLDEVKACDLMVLIVGRSITAAVREEVQTARQCPRNSPITPCEHSGSEDTAVPLLSLRPETSLSHRFRGAKS
jgi:Domain of unknown function (DUF4062)